MGLAGALIFLKLLYPSSIGSYGHQGFYTLFTISTTSILLLSSVVFAGVRRNTGLTFRRKAWTPINISASKCWLEWYDARITQLNRKAEERIEWVLQKYGPTIEDINVRAVWEQQLRDDVNKKMDRIKERRRICQDIVNNAESLNQSTQNSNNVVLPHTRCNRRRKHSRLFTSYLKIGEYLFDCIVAWMCASSVCCYEESNAPATAGLVSIDDLLAESDTPPRLSYPTPFIATAAAPSSSYTSSQTPLVPSAPLLPEADTSSLASTSESAALAALSTSLSSAQPGSSRHPNSALAYAAETISDLVGPFEPPPYTPLDDAYHAPDPSSDPPLLKEDSIR
ncbi:hypothetical protein COEREDRAFT_88147 [Coemansia reversa NRRL 1564]|uniref:Uncharacterized protein n=1 Tax=Coemansia reversa (strain ATCC 12441 / NRRL 1564) TaxID=763665 RepID=A0A2G5B8J0_COERN|nr:hypothetical protein COEREDRAFT_88147 [Coemansia reversa NRRL 1564]|eukprot:PIA15047.1 hypothetical protein COEREDRAFT_88147 [Coemansia reversa NRRL 1564]